jgi:DNA-binding PadR family transcriptional regulator
MSVRHALLALLSEGPRCGPQLRAEFAAVSEVRPPNAAQVHAALQRLECDGLAAADGAGADGPRKRFRITADGERELAGWLRTPPDLAAAPHDELATKVQLALRAPGTDVHEMMQVHRRYLVELMQRWTRIKQGNAGHDVRAALAVDAELFRLDSLIRWLDAADGHVERAEGHLGLISDADRERVTARLGDHYVEGRLTLEELDERVTATLNARTFGDLRRVMADLPESTPAP